jgi:hypothetical protein
VCSADATVSARRLAASAFAFGIGAGDREHGDADGGTLGPGTGLAAAGSGGAGGDYHVPVHGQSTLAASPTAQPGSNAAAAQRTPSSPQILSPDDGEDTSSGDEALSGSDAPSAASTRVPAHLPRPPASWTGAAREVPKGKQDDVSSSGMTPIERFTRLANSDPRYLPALLALKEATASMKDTT